MTPWPAHRCQVVDVYSRDSRAIENASMEVLASKTARAALATRSGAGAVRTCSSCSSPPQHSFFVPCAPTRCDAEKWARQSPGTTGSGGGSNCYQFATCAATVIALKSRHNSAGNSGSAQILARDARADVCADARVHARGEFLLPLLPTHFIHCYEVVSGSRIGSRAVTVVTDRRAVDIGARAAEIRRFAPNIIVGGYAVAVARSGDLLLFGGARRRKFWGSVRRSTGARSSAWADPASIDQARTNGGFPRLSACLIGHVGTAMLERSPQSRRNASVTAHRRQLCRLTEGHGGAISAEPPPGPPFAPSPSPSMLADAIFLISIEPRSIAASARAERAQSWKRQTGSGARAGLSRASIDLKKRKFRQWTTPNRGRGHGWSVDPRRIGAGSSKLWGAVSHVN